MLPREILRQVRRLRLQARRAVEDLLGGEYHSVFRGTGMAFEEVRAYQPGDDVRSIDWNVTARMSQPFVKRFVEERERTVLLALDVSGSLGFGTGALRKREAAAELAAVLAFTAVGNGDRVGLVQFTDRIEHYLRPAKGSSHVLRVIRDALFREPLGRRTGLADALDQINRAQRKPAIVFLFSDFLDDGFDRALRRLAARHDLIAVRLVDPLERSLPPAGRALLEDLESGRQAEIDTADPLVRRRYEEDALRRDEAVRRSMLAADADLVEATTDGRHVDALTAFFRRRRARRRS